jgi:nucleoside-diphosphate-sugar epimerase
MQFIHVEDLAEIAILAAEHPQGEGRAFNAANPDAVTQEQFVDALAVAAGGRFEKVFVPREELPDGAFGEYLDLPPIPQDTTNLREVLQFTTRPFAEGLRQTYLWWRSQQQSS